MSNNKKFNKNTQNYTSPKNKTPNVTNRPKTKHPRKQKAQIYKMSKATKCPKLQNVQNYKMSKVKKYLKLKFLAHFIFMFI